MLEFDIPIRDVERFMNNFRKQVDANLYDFLIIDEKRSSTAAGDQIHYEIAVYRSYEPCINQYLDFCSTVMIY
jgi:hypothetical protein